MRITNLWPQTAWPTVWKNLGETPVPGATKAAWYKVIHDILHTNVRLFRIRMVPTDACRKWDGTDTISHRLTECGEGKQIRTWTKQRVAWILRTIPERMPSDWLLLPHFTLWPPRRRRALLRVLANLVIFRTNSNGNWRYKTSSTSWSGQSGSCTSRIKGKRVWETTSL